MGNKDILCNSVFGVLTKPDSSESLYKGIVKMVNLTNDELNIISKNSFNRIKNQFSINGMAVKTTLLYNQTLKKMLKKKV